MSEATRLVILRSWKSVLSDFWPLLLLPSFIRDFSKDPGVFDGLLLLALVALIARHIQGLVDRRYVVVDDAGLWTSRRGTQPIPWSHVAAVAFQNQNRDRVLRIFQLYDEHLASPEFQFDVNFENAETPETSLELVVQACAARISPSRNPEMTSRPIREFVDRSSGEKATWFGRARSAAIVLGLALAMTVVGMIAIAALRPKHVIEEPPRPIDDRPG